MVAAQGLSKSYADQLIFQDVSFHINPGERIGLVGRNGHGKTTLFNILIGQEYADEGEISIPKSYRIGYLTQHIKFTEPTVLAEAGHGLEQFHVEEWQVKKLLMGLGFNEDDLDRPPDEFSGGYQVRLNLVKVLAAEPNLLLLDEPTNYLDIVSIRWLVRFLNQWKNELMIISHDRGFMDSVCTHTMGIYRCKIKKIEGPTQFYYDQVALEDEIHEKVRLNKEKKEKQLEEFINRFRAKARHATLVQSRVKTLAKLQKPDKLPKLTDLSYSFKSAPFQAKDMLDVQNVTFSYNGDAPYLIEDFSLSVHTHDRVCIVGKNGKGKTTLLKMLARRLEPLAGEIKGHPQVVPAYYEQSDTAGLHPDMTVEEEILYASPTGERQRVRDICGAMMFSGDNAEKRVAVLSGGEKCRVLLGQLLVAPANLLLLDEPTHHLDMPSCEAIIEAIEEFPGAAVVVTHDENFLRAVATKLVVFHQDRLFVFPGTYDEFLDRVGWGDEDDIAYRSKNKKPAPERDRDLNRNRKDLRKVRADFITRRSQAVNPLKAAVDGLESCIQKTEKELAAANAAMAGASALNDWEKSAELSRGIEKLKMEIDSYFMQLEVANAKYETAKRPFDEEAKTLPAE
jgi:ATP-binding cassette subfamily F protein 3